MWFWMHCGGFYCAGFRLVGADRRAWLLLGSREVAMLWGNTVYASRTQRVKVNHNKLYDDNITWACVLDILSL